MTRIVVALGGLFLLLGIEIVAAVIHTGWLGAAAAPPMILLVATLFMDIGRASTLSRIFAVAGLFWLAVLIGLTGTDYLTRHDFPTATSTGHR